MFPDGRSFIEYLRRRIDASIRLESVSGGAAIEMAVEIVFSSDCVAERYVLGHIRMGENIVTAGLLRDPSKLFGFIVGVTICGLVYGSEILKPPPT